MVLGAGSALYGATQFGGQGAGTIFQLRPPVAGGPWTESIIYTFQGLSDGIRPTAGLLAGKDGVLYGTTEYGGGQGGGTVFELNPPVASGPWTETILHDFGAAGDGNDPVSGVVMGPVGTLYGTTYAGGLGTCCGTVFELKPPTSASGAWSEISYNLTSADGYGPYFGSVALDQAGRIFGAASWGGSRQHGTVFEITF